MKKILYSLPAILICLIYGYVLFVLEGTFDAVIDAVHSVVIVYILLPVIGSILLVKGNWWGSLFGTAMGLLLIWNNLLYTGHQHVNIDLPLGIVYILYYLICGILCGRSNRNKGLPASETERMR